MVLHAARLLIYTSDHSKPAPANPNDDLSVDLSRFLAVRVLQYPVLPLKANYAQPVLHFTWPRLAGDRLDTTIAFTDHASCPHSYFCSNLHKAAGTLLLVALGFLNDFPE